IVLVCNEGYSSSLAAHTLQQLGLPGATDLVGGYQAWAAWLDQRLDRSTAGRPVSRVARGAAR
ncbi:MAG TPA: rhodanese-like domain-containing protein, partial [Nocardioides sp.]|nr:rhodanese-like domain-containing protein [Nocardioides sp.]